MKVSIVYITSRREPKWEWFIDSLFAQTTEEQRADIQLVVIDGHLWWEGVGVNGDASIHFSGWMNHDMDRRIELKCALRERFPNVLHIPPKPCAYQGPFRQTTRDLFCAGNSRNTAFVVAQHPYVVFVDDLSVLMPQWFLQLAHAAHDQYIVAGAYKKVLHLCINPLGGVDFYEDYPAGVDSRWERGSDGGVVPWYGSALYGCSFGVPLEAALEVDGNDAAYNGQGAEDTDFGIRLERAGWPIFYNRNLLTLESEELHHNGSKLPQERKLVTPDRLPPNYDSYQVVNQEERYFSDHVMLNRLANETERILPVIGDNLRAVREHFLRTGLVPIPQPEQRDWRDGKLLAEL